MSTVLNPHRMHFVWILKAKNDGAVALSSYNTISCRRLTRLQQDIAPKRLSATAPSSNAIAFDS